MARFIVSRAILDKATKLLRNISEHEIDIDLMPKKSVQKSEV